METDKLVFKILKLSKNCNLLEASKNLTNQQIKEIIKKLLRKNIKSFIKIIKIDNFEEANFNSILAILNEINIKIEILRNIFNHKNKRYYQGRKEGFVDVVLYKELRKMFMRNMCFIKEITLFILKKESNQTCVFLRLLNKTGTELDVLKHCTKFLIQEEESSLQTRSLAEIHEFYTNKAVYSKYTHFVVKRAVLKRKLQKNIFSDLTSVKYGFILAEQCNCLKLFYKVYGNYLEDIFRDFINLYKYYSYNKEIMKLVNKKEMESEYKHAIEGFYDKKENCDFTAELIDFIMSIRINKVGVYESLYPEFSFILDPENEKEKILKIISEIVNSSNPNSGILPLLHKKLSLRLLRQDLSNMEPYFINLIKNTKMKRMVEDKQNSDNSILLITKFIWPHFNSESVEVDEIKAIKDTVQSNLKSQRKIVNWLDSLSSVVIKIFNSEIRVSLIQFNILKNILNAGNFIEGNSQCFSIAKEKIFLDEILKPHFNALVGPILMESDEFYSFKTNLESPIECKTEFKENLIETQKRETKNYTNFINESKISKLMKRNKEMNIKILEDEIEGSVEETILSLEEKGIVERRNGMLYYLP